MKRFIIVFLCVLFPVSTFASEPLSRRDGFLMIWEAIKRPAEPAKTVFSDVPIEAPGSLEIDYAASRGIIGDEQVFRPDEPLTLETALIWLFRTRNVTDDPASVNPANMGGVLARYPIALYTAETALQSVTREDVSRLMNLLDTQLKTEEHEVSLYAEKFHGKGTAFGEKFDMHAMTAAHRSLPSNTLVRVTNVRNGKSVVVRINDRGPFVEGRDMDLSLAAFTAIEDRSKGKFMATFERLGDFRLTDETVTETASVVQASAPVSCDLQPVMQRRLSGGVALDGGIPTVFRLGETLMLSAPEHFVIREVRYPDGTGNRFQDFVLAGEHFSFKPSVEGEYVFIAGGPASRALELTMRVAACG